MGRPVAPRNVSDVSNHVCHTSYCDFSWQACVPRHATHMQHDTQHARNVGKTQGFFVFAYFLKVRAKECFKGRAGGEMAKKEKSLSFFNLSCVLRVVLHVVLHVCCMSCHMASVFLATATPTTTASSHGVQLQTRVRFAICRAPEQMGGISQCMPGSANVTSLSHYWRYGCRFLVFTSL